jgi:hypothetical protein
VARTRKIEPQRHGEQRTEDIEDVGGWRSGPAGLEVGGKIRESGVRCQWFVAREAKSMWHGVKHCGFGISARGFRISNAEMIAF